MPLQIDPLRKLLTRTLLLMLLSLAACRSQEQATLTVPPSDAAAAPATGTSVTGDGAATPAAPVEAPTNTAVPATATPAPTPTATPAPITVYYADGSETTMAPLPPAGYTELLAERVAAGEWTETEGVIQLLKLFAGELSVADLPAAGDVLSESGTGLIRHAHDLVADPETDPAARAEIERLLNRLTPSAAALELYSVPESEARSGKSTVLGRRLAQGDECADLEADGFPTEDVAGFPCFTYKEAEVNGYTYRAYYPLSWQDDAEKQALVGEAMTGLTDSATTFSQLATIKDVNLIFSLRPGTSLAHQTPFPQDDPCPITLFSRSKAKGMDVFKQTIAHEVFHCVQDWNFTTSPYASHSWWMEGTAEYFSNVVYPAVNDEHRFLASFNIRSVSSSLMEMNYHNFIFFQYLANETGDAALISLLDTMSAAGAPAAQRQVLAGYGDMSGIFQEFVVSFMSEGIPDTSGAMIVVDRPAILRTDRVEEEGEREFKVRPFVPARFGVRYLQEKRFLQEGQPSGDGRHSAVEGALRRDKSAWSDVPPEVRSSCKEDSLYALAVTTVGTGEHTFKVDVHTMEVAECDPCLLGTWDVDHQSFTDYIARIAATIPESGAFSMVVTGGHQYTQFMEDGDMLTRRDAFELTMTSPGAPPLVSTTDSHGQGEYSADGEELTVMGLYEVVDHSTMTMGGEAISVELVPGQATVNFFGQTATTPGDDLYEGELGTTAAYVCTDETLTLTMEEYGDILFHRVDEILPTPVPTPAP